MTLKKRKFAQKIKKGFVEVRDSDHVYFYPLASDGTKIVYIRTKFSHSSDKDIDEWTENKISKQLYFDDKRDLETYLACKKTHKEYLDQLVRKGKYKI